MKAKLTRNIYFILLQFAVFFLLFINTEIASSQIYGLKFQSHDVVLDKRTELDLSPSDFLNFHKEFEMSFDYNIYLSTPNVYSGLFGYIFRIISIDGKNIDLVTSSLPTRSLHLIIGSSDSLINLGSIDNALDGWVNLRVKFILNEDKLVFYTPDSFYTIENIGLKKNDSFKILFGANNYGNFKTSDVPSMNIKDIRISEDGVLRYHWPLDEEQGSKAESRLDNADALVKNPVWVKHYHSSWEDRFKKEIKGQVLIASDSDSGRLFFIGDNELLIYSASDNLVESVKYSDKTISINNNFNSVYNTLDNKIYCYTVNEKVFYCLDVSSGKWNEIKAISNSETFYRHYNSYFNPDENAIYIFGGYGQYMYHNEILRLDLTKREWQEITGNDSIFYPRYLAGLGSLNDTIFILGGYGSTKGSQLVNPHSFFDLIGYSIKDRVLFRKFEIPRIYDDMCVGSGLWINGENRDFYALVYEKIKFESTLQLIKGNLARPDVEFVGDKIPYRFYDIRSNASLFYFSTQKKLFAYTSFVTDSLTTQISIYSIGSPPSISSLESLSVNNSRNILMIIIAGTLLIFLVIISLYAFRMGWITKKTKQEVKPVESAIGNKIGYAVGGKPLERQNYQIVLFGGFQVYNLNNVDITNKFSPLLKELFLLIFLFTYKNNKGITSDKISEYLWFGKSTSSARNNRAVNIAKLKTILNEIGAVELTKKTGYWKIIFNNDLVKSDYHEFVEISGSKTNLTKVNICRLLEITRKGGFLINSNYEWLDDFKSDISDSIVDTLVTFAEKCNLETEAEFIIHLTDCIFNFDKVNEEAMILKCKAECFLGNHSLAKMTYEKFVREYQKIYGEEFKRPFNELTKS